MRRSTVVGGEVVPNDSWRIRLQPDPPQSDSCPYQKADINVLAQGASACGASLGARGIAAFIAAW